jgi:UDP-N-acetylmuramoylalanine--D-glutamate ligase
MEYAVLNYDDPIVRELSEKTKAKVFYFSTKQQVPGAYYENGDLYFDKEKILSAKEIPSEGLHTIQNVLAVIIAARLMGVSTEDIRTAIMDFKGIKHRIEVVAEINGVEFIDDSKGTNVDATLKAVDCMKKETILLLGGKNKGYDYAKLFASLPTSKVVHSVLYGENRYALLKSAREKGYNKLTLCEGFDFAVRIAAMKAEKGQTVLLSPASASFDEFTGYEERGDKFVEIIQDFKKSNESEFDVSPSNECNEEEVEE